MKITGREKRFLSLLVFSAVFFAFMNWVVLPWGEHFLTSPSDLSMAEKKLRQERELLASRPQIEAEVKVLQARLDDQEKRLLPISDSSQASAQFQQWLSQRAAEQKLDLLRTDFLPVAPLSDSYTRVPIRVELLGPITQTVQFMNAITHGDRAVAIDELSVTTPYVDKEKKVRCSMVITALMAKGS